MGMRRTETYGAYPTRAPNTRVDRAKNHGAIARCMPKYNHRRLYPASARSGVSGWRGGTDSGAQSPAFPQLPDVPIGRQ